MNPSEFAFSAALAALLTALACYFGWKQFQTLRSLRTPSADNFEDHRYQRRQAYRRLLSCALMLVMAAMLVGWFWLESDYRQVIQEVQVAQAAGDGQPEPQPEHKAFVRAFTAYVSAALLVLLAFVVLAVLDMGAIARFGLRQHRQLRNDHQALLDDQLARLRSERNGHG